MVELPSTLQTRVDSRLADGDYVDGADYLRNLVRRDRSAAERRWLKAIIDEGLESGVCEQDAFSVLDEVITEDPDVRG